MAAAAAATTSSGQPADRSLIKTERYDRQLRLWGADGQAGLESANILALTASVVCAEALKDLVLPGLGKFTLVDAKKVDVYDLGNQFFVTEADLGKSRAQVVTSLLCELNPFASGTPLEQDPVELIEKTPDFVKKFNLVLSTNGIPEATLLKLSTVCAQSNIPLVVVRSYGQFGLLRIQGSAHSIVDVKPANPVPDLRVTAPFPELVALAASFNTVDPESHDYPYVVLMMKALDKYRADHAGAYPLVSKQKDEFKEKYVKALNRTPKGDLDENIAEALSAVNVVVKKYDLPWNVQEVFKVLAAPPATVDVTSEFWILAAALKEFVDNEGKGQLPLTGAVPDMVSSTANYKKVVDCYRNKYLADLQAMRQRVAALSTKHARPPVADNVVEEFVKNSASINVVTFRPIADEYKPKDPQVAQGLSTQAMVGSADPCLVYLAFRALDRFFTKNSRYPAVFDDEIAKDLPAFTAELSGLLKELGSDDWAADAQHIAAEFVRAGSSELHNVSSILGGVCAQEILKLRTRKWSPVGNTWVYNGMRAVAAPLNL